MSIASSDAGATEWVPSSSIVVIDDDEESRRLTAEVLRRAGYRVQTSPSACAVSDALEPSPRPDLIVLGVVPRRAEWISREAQRGPFRFADVPTLALRGEAAVDADAFLPTPFMVRDLLHAVKVLLTFAAGRALGTRAEVVDVGAVLELSLRLASRELAERAHVTREFDRQLRVCANPEQLCLIFLNLLLNAASSIEEGHAAANGIRVAGWRTAEGRTVVEISDTGKGIAPDRLAHIFDPRADGRAELGPGLSLARSRDVLHLAGGSITVTSRLGCGASFRVELPTAEG